jgi:hypothetical protein
MIGKVTRHALAARKDRGVNQLPDKAVNICAGRSKVGARIPTAFDRAALRGSGQLLARGHR